MKKISIITMIAVFGFLFSNCDDFINVSPSGVIDDEIAYSSPEEMVTPCWAIVGIPIRSIYGLMVTYLPTTV